MMKKNGLRILLSLIDLEGWLALPFVFLIPSMQRNTDLFNYSTTRLLAGAALFFPLVFLSYVAFRSWKDEIWAAGVANSIERWVSKDLRLLALSVILIFMACAGLAVFILFRSPLSGWVSSLSWVQENLILTIQPLIARTWSIILWVVLVCIQCQVGLFKMFPARFKEPAFWDIKGIFRTLIICLMASLAVIHWGILYFNLYLFASIPNWFWKFYNKPLAHPWFGVVVFIITVLVVAVVLKKKEWKWRNILLVIALGYFLQVGFACVEGRGFETLRVQFNEKGHFQYPRYAARGMDLVKVLTNYEEVAEIDPFFRTKPPGILTFYIVIERAVQFFTGEVSWEARYLNLITVMAYVFPLIAMLMVPLLYFFSAPMVGKVNAILPGVIYVLLPNVILTPLFLDQELFPLLFVVGLIFIQKCIYRQSWKWGAIAGIWFYISIFFSFSLLPLLPLMLAWVGLDLVFHIKDRKFTRVIILFLGIIGGVCVAYLLFRVCLGYDFFTRYQQAMLNHRLHKEFQPGIQVIINAVVVNNLEFGSWIGFPIVLLVVSYFIKTVSNAVHLKPDSAQILFSAALITYILLNFLGQTHGEVARLWLFLVPLVAFFASQETMGLFKKRAGGFYLLLFLQMVTIFLLFKYQDLD